VTEPDAILRRLERNALIVCASMTIGAAIIARERVGAAVGVIAGGALAAISYHGIKAGADALVSAVQIGQNNRKNAIIGLVKFFTRYGILAAVAYVTMARARLPPLAVIAGASSLVVAVTVEAINQWKSSSPNSGSSRP
jgi:hypothetical protein